MVKGNRGSSLTFKLAAVLLLSGVAAILCFFLCRLAGRGLIDRVYMAPDRAEARVSRDIGSFRDYVARNQVASSDVKAIGAWNREHPFVRLTVSGRDSIIASDGYGAELLLSSSAMLLWTGRETEYTFPVNFLTGPIRSASIIFRKTVCLAPWILRRSVSAPCCF